MFVKIVCLLSTLAAISCTHSDGGHSTSFREQDNHGNYKFGYNIKDKHGAENSREEKGDGHGGVHGSYTLHDGHGKRVVHYVADKSGFRAKIQTNEAGTSHEDAADAIYNGLDDHKGNYGNDYSNQQNHDNNNGHNYKTNHNNYDNHDSYDGDSYGSSHYYD
ncbi:unnamed protein product [Medioppia subpectinata]|uniref:Uncharacterized protein n=1 Tax=Medioppia subpectinata TaxID=1979941 RepID=A0A7R9KBP5_9ACAR|nr:unnamed protein product [Medioppia subpectinata]CAG2100355.1 unnamed protein product [Medioppia subpectinata]